MDAPVSNRLADRMQRGGVGQLGRIADQGDDLARLDGLQQGVQGEPAELARSSGDGVHGCPSLWE